MNKFFSSMVLMLMVCLPASVAWGIDLLPNEFSHRTQFFPPRPSEPPSSSPRESRPKNQPVGEVKSIAFSAILGGDFHKAFISLNNLRSPKDSQFVLAPSLAGRLTLERFEAKASPSQDAFFHVHGLSVPPQVTSDNKELRLSFSFPSIKVKGFYGNYSSQGDSAIPDSIIEKGVLDIYFIPDLDMRGYPTYQSARVTFSGKVRELESCGVWFDIIYRFNVCDAVQEYLEVLTAKIPDGIRDALHHPQTRIHFERFIQNHLRTLVLGTPGVPLPPGARFQMGKTRFQGTDYVIQFFRKRP